MLKIIDESEDKTFIPIPAKGMNGHLYLIVKDFKTKKLSYINLRNGMKFDTNYENLEEFKKEGNFIECDVDLIIKK